MNILRIAALLAALGLSACASASDYQSGIDKFADATSKASDSLVAIDKAAAATVTAQNRELALKSPNLVIYHGCTGGDAECTLYLQDPQDKSGSKDAPLVVNSLIPHHVEAMQALSDYTQALKAIVATNSTSSVNASLGSITSSGTSLIKLADPKAQVPDDLAKLTVNLGTWVFDRIQEEMKLRAIKDATRAMRAPVRTAADHFEDAKSFASWLNEGPLQNNFTSLHDDYISPPGTPEKLDALSASAQKLDGVLRVRSSKLFSEFADAHDKLADALDGKGVTLAQAISQIDRFATVTQQLVSYVQAYQESQQSKKTN